MRFKATKARLLCLSLLAALALTAIAASAAQAATAEGPFYKITGTRLASGKSQEIKAKMYSGNPFSFEIPNSGVKVGCTSAKFASGAKLLGSTGANAAGGEATIELSGCNTGGSSCELTSSTIKTEPLTMKMAYLNEARTGGMLMTFEPPKGILGEVTFREGDCDVPGEWALGGHLVGKVEVASKLVEVGKEPAATKVLRITFPGLTEINTAWFEKNGTLEKKKVELVVNGSAPPYNGALELELSTGAEWGIFT